MDIQNCHDLKPSFQSESPNGNFACKFLNENNELIKNDSATRQQDLNACHEDLIGVRMNTRFFYLLGSVKKII